MRFMHRPHLVLAMALALLSRPALAAEYHWAAVGSASWNAPSSWSPVRATPLTTDRLVFDGGGAALATGVPTATIAQLAVANGTRVTLIANGSGNALTIAGDTGTDLDVAAGDSLTLAGANALLLNLATGATATIAGDVAAGGGAHRIEAIDADAIQFTAGSSAATLTAFTGSLFGPSTGFSTANSVRFLAGSAYNHGAGSNPFALPQPASIVVFDPGSLYRLNTSVSLSIAGRTFANLEYNGSGTSLSTGSADCNVDSLVVNSGTMSLELNARLYLHGAVRVRSNAVLNLGPTTGSVVVWLVGTVPQVLADSSSAPSGIVFRPSVQLAIGNPAGVETSANGKDLTVPGSTTFSAGMLTLRGASRFVLGSTGLVGGASQAVGWVNGPMSIDLTPANNSRRFETGTSTVYAPFDCGMLGLTATSRVVESTLPIPDPTFFTGSQIDGGKKLNVYYRVTTDGVPNWSNLLLTGLFDPSGVDPGANANAFVMRAFSYPANAVPAVNAISWRPTTVTHRTPTEVTVLGVTRQTASDAVFGFALGESTLVHVAGVSNAVAENSGALPIKVRLSERSVYPVSVHYQTVDGTAIASSDYGATSSSFAYAPGATELTVSVPLIPDTVPEADETFTVALTNPTNAVVDAPDAVGTILDDDDVSAPTAQVLYPNGGETLTEGANVNLLWSATDNVAVAGVDLLLTRDNGATFEPIASALANTGSYNWTVTPGLTHAARLEVVAHDVHALAGSDQSDDPLSIWGVDGVTALLPTAFAFELASGNPSRGTSRLRYALPRDVPVRIAVYDAAGRRVATLLDGPERAGMHDLAWDGGKATGAAATGVYFVRFSAPGWSAQRKLVRMR